MRRTRYIVEVTPNRFGHHGARARQFEKKISVFSTFTICLTIAGLLLAVFNSVTYASAANMWDFSNASDYTFDNNKIQVSNGVAQLKPTFTPGTDWIANDGSGNSWQYRKAVTIDHTKVANTNQTDFPFVISVTHNDFRSTGNGGHVGKSDGTDILFTSSNATTKLSHELERYNATTGEVIAWVKVPSLSTSVDTVLYMYYGNASASNQQNATDVWSNGYSSVWHFPNGSSLTASDSTSNANTGTISGTTATTGLIDGGANFDGNDSISSAGNGITYGTNFTVEVQFKTSSNGWRWLMTRPGGSWLGIEPTGKLVWTRAPGSDFVSTKVVTDNIWYHGVATYNNGTLKLYANGVEVGSFTSVTVATSTGTLWFGFQGSTEFFIGLMDEARTSTVTRSADWITTTYNNQNSPSTFSTFGSEEHYSLPTDNPTITNNTPYAYTSLLGFIEVLTTDSTGTIKYQLSPNNGSTWYWWDGDSWEVTVAGFTESSSAANINSNIGTFTSSGQFKWRAYLNSDGTQIPKLSKIALGLTQTWPFTTSGDYTFDSGKVTVSGGIATLVAASAFTPGTNWIATSGGSDWNYRKTITIDHTKVVNTNQTNFPVLISITDTSLRTTGNGGHVGKSDGTDILFTSSNATTKLSHELERYNATTGEVIAWVKVPTLSASVDTVLYLYYGNASASNQQNVTDVWSNSYAGVWNLPDGSSLSTNDSTANGYNGTLINSPTAIEGKIDGAGNFATASSRGIHVTGTNLNITTGSWEAWVKPTSTNDFRRIIYKSNSGGNGFDYELFINPSGSKFQAGGGGGAAIGTTTVSAGTTYHVVGTYDADAVRVYVNGALEATDSAPNGNLLTSTNPLGIGKSPNDNSFTFDGTIDSVRISTTPRSGDWIGTEYNNQNSPSTFSSTGSETPLAQYPTDNPTITNNSSLSYNQLLGFIETLGSGSGGNIKYQVSPDNGSNWYWWDGDSWEITSSGYTQSNTASEVDDAIDDLSVGGTKQFKWRAYLNSDGIQQPKLDTITALYDTTPLLAPQIGASTSITTSSITWNWTDQSTTETSFKLHDASHNLIQSVTSTSTGTTGTAYSYQESGLSVNTAYARHVHAHDGSTEGSASGTVTTYTLANVPGTPTVGNISTTGVTITLATNSNPASTEFAIYESSTNQYAQANGTLGASAVWQTFTNWGGGSGKNITGLNPNATYTFSVKARNGDNTETALSSSVNAVTLANVPGAPSLTNVTTTTMKVTISTNSNPASTEFAIFESSTSQYVQGDGSLGATAVWQSYASWGGASGKTVAGLSVNTQYTFAVKARNSALVETALSSSSSATTNAGPTVPVMGAASQVTKESITWNWTDQSTTETSFKLHFSNHGLVQSIASTTTGSTGTAYSYQEGSLSLNTSYARHVHAHDGSDEGAASATVTAYTLAAVPGTPSLSGFSSESVTITLSTNNNPAITQYAIYESGTGKYVQSNGTLGSSAIWQTFDAWGGTSGFLVNGLSPETAYAFFVKARNGDNVETALSSSANGSTTVRPATPTPTPTGVTEGSSKKTGTTVSSDETATSTSTASTSETTAENEETIPQPTPTFSQTVTEISEPPSTSPITPEAVRRFIAQQFKVDSKYGLGVPLGAFIVATPSVVPVMVKGFLAIAEYSQFLWVLLLLASPFQGKDKKRVQPWGRVTYGPDQTPLPFAAIRLYSLAQYGKLIAMTATDRTGNFGFDVAPGSYIISVFKTGYSFPSNVQGIQHNSHQLNYNPSVGMPNIVLNGQENRQHFVLGSILRTMLLLVGFGYSLYFFITTPILLNGIYVFSYIVLLVINSMHSKFKIKKVTLPDRVPLTNQAA